MLNLNFPQALFKPQRQGGTEVHGGNETLNAQRTTINQQLFFDATNARIKYPVKFSVLYKQRPTINHQLFLNHGGRAAQKK